MSVSPHTAKLRLVHNVAQAPNVDVILDGRVLKENIPYKKVTDYVSVQCDRDRVIQVFAHATNSLIVEATVRFDHNQAYTLIVHGLIAQPQSIAALLLQDDLSRPATGKAHVRFVHAAAGAPAVDIYAGGQRVFAGVSYGSTGNPVYLPVPYGKVNLTVRLANKSDIALGPLPVVLDNTGIYTIIASGLVGNSQTPLTALVAEDTHGSCIHGDY